MLYSIVTIKCLYCSYSEGIQQSRKFPVRAPICCEGYRICDWPGSRDSPLLWDFKLWSFWCWQCYCKSTQIAELWAWVTLMTMQVNVSWPLKTTDGDWLLYLTEAPVIKVSQKKYWHYSIDRFRMVKNTNFFWDSKKIFLTYWTTVFWVTEHFRIKWTFWKNVIFCPKNAFFWQKWQYDPQTS